MSVLELSICQFPLVIPSANEIEDTCSILCNVVGLFDIPRFAEVGVALQQILDIRLPALGRCLVVPHPVEGCAPMTLCLVLLGGLHRRLLLAFHGRSGPPVDEPLRRGTASALQAGEERCGYQLIQEVVNRQVGGEWRIWGAIRLILGGVTFHRRAENEDGGGPLDRSAEEGKSHEEPLRLGAEKGQELGQKNIIRGERDRLGDRYVQIPRSVEPIGHVHAAGQSPLQPLPQILLDARQPPPAVSEQGVEHFQCPWVPADARPQHVQLIVVERFHVGEVPGQAQGLAEGQRAQSPPSQVLAAVIGQFEAVPAGDEQRGRTLGLGQCCEEVG